MAGGRVVFTVFAGRRRFLSILLSYVRRLLSEGVVDEVHVWDYCRLPADREYLSSLASEGERRISVIKPPESDLHARFPHKWKGYYAHYAASLRIDDILIKCDDDVVFISNLHKLLDFVRSDNGANRMYYPSVVNNDVSAAFQAADGIITDAEYTVALRPSRPEGPWSRSPISDWYNCTACAQHVHSLFLKQPEAFFTGCVHQWRMPARVPINFFVMAGRTVRETFRAYTNEVFVDEAYLTAVMTQRSKVPSAIISDCVVVHFSFSFQHLARPRELLEQYRVLARNQQLHSELTSKFGSRSLNWSCPATAPSRLLQGRRVLQTRSGAGGGRGNHSRLLG